MIPTEQIIARHIVFDLDGTLIDSAPAIIGSFEKAFVACGRIPVVPLTASLIGPPLWQTMETLAGTNDQAVLNPLVEAFKTHYDEAGYRQTTIITGVPEMLEELRRGGHCLYLATNKRITPTLQILHYFGWRDHFTAIYALDSYVPALKTKAELLARIVQKHGFDAAKALYVGDRNEDGEAASANGMGFLMVKWGYGVHAIHKGSSMTACGFGDGADIGKGIDGICLLPSDACQLSPCQ